MKKSKNTKRALLMSVLSMMLCVAMLIGSTFAWFTDTVTSGKNKIVAGNLDVQLLMKTTEGSDYEDISDSEAPIFGSGSIAQDNNAETLWEPGKTQVAYLAIKNNGNLALKYKVNLNVQNVSKNLYEVMQYNITPDAQYGAVKSWAGNGKSVVPGSQLVSDSDVFLDAGKTHYFALSIHMKEEATNDYMDGEVDFDLTVFATQATAESDSFGSDYDKNASLPWSGKIATAEELAAAKNEETKTLSITSPELFAAFSEDVKKGTTYDSYTVELKDSIDMNNLEWTPVGTTEHPFKGSFNGNKYSVKGLSRELFGCVNSATIMDLSITVDSITGGLIADASGTNKITNVTVNGTIIGNADNKNAAFILETKEGSDTTMTNCVNNANVTSNIESAAGYVGSAYGKLTFNGCVNNGNMVSTKATGAKATGYIVTVRPNAVVAFIDCENDGDISVRGSAELYGAGFICWNGSAGAVVTITNCTNNGNITGERIGNGGSTIALGGIIGTCWNDCETTLTNVTNNGKISAVNNATEHNAHVGGIIGMANPNAKVIIKSATSNGALSCAVNNTVGSPNVGGLIGQVNNATLTIESATITENVTVAATVVTGSTMPLNIDALLGNVTTNSIVNVSSESITNKSTVSCRYTD